MGLTDRKLTRQKKREMTKKGRGISKERATVSKMRNREDEGSRNGVGVGSAFNLTGSHLPSRWLVSGGKAIKTSVPATLQAQALLSQSLNR